MSANINQEGILLHSLQLIQRRLHQDVDALSVLYCSPSPVKTSKWGKADRPQSIDQIVLATFQEPWFQNILASLRKEHSLLN